MFEARDPANEIVSEANRTFVVASGPVRAILDFPPSEIAGTVTGRKFKFQKKWYKKFNWLEYSV